MKKRRGDFRRRRGIFLGYSFEDVEGFAGISEKECMMTGYWKVYGHRAEKEMLFMIYDQVKMWAVNEFPQEKQREKSVAKANQEQSAG